MAKVCPNVHDRGIINDLLVMGGGIIPADDVKTLNDMGVEK